MVWVGLEGTDGTGKTSLAEAVRRELKELVATGALPFGSVEVIHRGPPEKSVLEEYATDVEGREDDHLVFDRWHLGTCVYAPLYRATGPYGELGMAGFRWVEKFLQARGARFYVIDQPYEVVKRRLEVRGEDYLQAHHVEGVLERFREVNRWSTLTGEETVVPPDDVSTVDEVARTIVKDALLFNRDVGKLRRFPSYVGGPWPDVLLVGEKRGGQPPFISQACFMAVKNRSGEFLWNALPDPFWRRVGAVNALEDDVLELHELLDHPPVVALGRAASEALEKNGIPHGAVPHPQFVKRFHTSRQTEYGKLIEEVAKTQERYAWPN